MATAAVNSNGTLLKAGDGGGPETFTTIAEVLDITGPGFTLDTEETTSHDSNGWKEFIATLKDAGEVSFELNFFAHATQGPTSGLYNDFNNRTKRNFQLVFPTTPNKTAAFSAFVTQWQPEAPVQGRLKVSATLKITGAPTWS